VIKEQLTGNKLLSKANIAFFIALCTLFGLFSARAVNSLGMFAFGVVALWGVHPKKWFKDTWWILGVLWVGYYAVSYFWSANNGNWHERIETKLPFLILPLAFTFLPALSKKQLRLYTVFAAILLWAGIIYTAIIYFHDPIYYQKQYSYSNILPVLMGNDHICFSITVTLYIIWSISFWQQLGSKILKWFIGISIAALVIYLHFLSAKTGLFALYLFFLAWGIYIAMKKNKTLGIGILAGGALFVFIAFTYIPTFKLRTMYVFNTYREYKSGNVSVDFSDMGRMVSYDIATKLIKEHPLAGVGAGDILDEMKKGYDRWYPQVRDEQRLFPHNQFLTVGLGCGIPAMLLFAVWAFFPLFKFSHGKNGFFFFCSWLALMVPLMVEPFLEIQYGVFVYLFFLLWQRQLVINKEEETNNDEFHSHISA